MKKTLLISILMVAAAAANAQDNNGSIIFTASAGFSVGGTAPLQMPAEIRSINSFSLTPNYQASLKRLSVNAASSLESASRTKG